MTGSHGSYLLKLKPSSDRGTDFLMHITWLYFQHLFHFLRNFSWYCNPLEWTSKNQHHTSSSLSLEDLSLEWYSLCISWASPQSIQVLTQFSSPREYKGQNFYDSSQGIHFWTQLSWNLQIHHLDLITPVFPSETTEKNPLFFMKPFKTHINRRPSLSCLFAYINNPNSSNILGGNSEVSLSYSPSTVACLLHLNTC